MQERRIGDYTLFPRSFFMHTCTRITRNRKAALRAAQAASWAYVLLIIAICGLLSLALVMPGHLFLLFIGVHRPAAFGVLHSHNRAWRAPIQQISTQEHILNAIDPSITLAQGSGSDNQLASVDSAGQEMGRGSGEDHSVKAPTFAADRKEHHTPQPAVKLLPNTSTGPVDRRTAVKGTWGSQVGAPANWDQVDGEQPRHSTLLESLARNTTVEPTPTIPELMALDARKTPAEWQAHFQMLSLRDENFNYQSSGHVSPWLGDFMDAGVPCNQIHVMSLLCLAEHTVWSDAMECGGATKKCRRDVKPPARKGI
jgi:hypothetical protein